MSVKQLVHEVDEAQVLHRGWHRVHTAPPDSKNPSKQTQLGEALLVIVSEQVKQTPAVWHVAHLTGQVVQFEPVL